MVVSLLMRKLHELRSSSMRHLMRPGKPLLTYLQNLRISEFRMPFHAIMVLKLDVGRHWKVQARMLIEKWWTTSWDGGKIVNCEAVVPERETCMISKTAPARLPYKDGRSNRFFASVLLPSD